MKNVEIIKARNVLSLGARTNLIKRLRVADYRSLTEKIEQEQEIRFSLRETSETEYNVKRRVAEFRKTLEQNEGLETFDRYIFECMVEKVIVGGYDEDGNKDPSMLTFIYKTGFQNGVDGGKFKPPRKNGKAVKESNELCSHTRSEADEVYLHYSHDTRGERGPAGKCIKCPL